MQFSDEKQKIDAILADAHNILVISHKQPDLDAIGSALGFKWYINKYFPHATSRIVFTGSLGDLKESLSFLQGIEWLETVEDISEIVSEFDTLVFLDGSELHRFTGNESMNISRHKSICIDHHLGDPADFTYYFRDTSFASCSELVCEILMSNSDLEDTLPSYALYIGVYGDTGSFTFVNADKAKVHSTARRLIEHGKIDVQSLLLNLTGIKEEDFDIMRILIKNTRNAKSHTSMPSFTYSYFSKKDIEGLSDDLVKPGRAYYVARFLRNVKGYPWGFVITPVVEQEKYTLSLRSAPGGLNVQEIGKLFDGGGHIHASGGTINKEILSISVDEFNKLDGDMVCDLVIEKVQDAFDAGIVTKT